MPNNLIISDIQIRQDTEGRFCLNDLHKAAGYENKHRPSLWLKNKQAIELVDVIAKAGNPALEQNQPVNVINGGNQPGTYVVKPLVYAYAMWISPVFHLHVIEAYDALVTQNTLDFEFLKPITEPITIEDFDWRYQVIMDVLKNLKNATVTMKFTGAELLAGKCFEK
jgi:hypothetical protein